MMIVHRCSFPGCGREFTKANNLKQHERTHTGERPYSCSKCGRTFKQNGALYNHKRVHVNDFLNLRCPVILCTALFSSSRNLRRHLKDRHPDQANLILKRVSVNNSEQTVSARKDSDSLSQDAKINESEEYSSDDGGGNERFAKGRDKILNELGVQNGRNDAKSSTQSECARELNGAESTRLFSAHYIGQSQFLYLLNAINDPILQQPLEIGK